MIRVAVVGLGRAGSRGGLRSHVGAVLACPGLEIVALADPDPRAVEAARRQWPGLAAAPERPRDGADLVVLATPHEDRGAQVEEALRWRPRALLAEKPLAATAAEAAAIARRCEEAGVVLRVNFQRRFDPAHRELRRSLPGPPLAMVARYGKGLLNYASHLVDLLFDWWGPVAEVQAVGDPAAANPSFACRMEAGFDAHVVGISGAEYDQFEIELYYPRGRWELAAGGCEKSLSEAVAELYYPGYAQLGPRRLLGPAGPVGGLVETYSALVDHLESGAPLPGCDGRAAARGLAVLEAVGASAAQGGRRVQPERIL